MEKILITGANGFIGTELIRQLSERGKEIYAVIKDVNEDVSALQVCANVKIIYCDLE